MIQLPHVHCDVVCLFSFYLGVFARVDVVVSGFYRVASGSLDFISPPCLCVAPLVVELSLKVHVLLVAIMRIHVLYV